MGTNELTGTILRIDDIPNSNGEKLLVTVALDSGTQPQVVVEITTLEAKALGLQKDTKAILSIPYHAITLGTSSFSPTFNRKDDTAVSDYVDPYENRWRIVVTGKSESLDAFLKEPQLMLYAVPITQQEFEQARALVDKAPQSDPLPDDVLKQLYDNPDLLYNIELIERKIEGEAGRVHLLRSGSIRSDEQYRFQLKQNDCIIHIGYSVSGGTITLDLAGVQRGPLSGVSTIEPVSFAPGGAGVLSVTHDANTYRYVLNLDIDVSWQLL